jgi:hypothetical protein
LTRHFRDFSVLSAVIIGGIKKMITKADGSRGESARGNDEGKGGNEQQDRFWKGVPVRVIVQNWSIVMGAKVISETSFWYDVLKSVDGSEEVRAPAKVPRVSRDPLDGMSIDRWFQKAK